MCGSNDKVCQSVKRRKTNLIEKYAVSNGEGAASSSSPSDASGVTLQTQRMELFRAARENPDRFPLVNMEYKSERGGNQGAPHLARIDAVLYCSLCAYRYHVCQQRFPRCSRYDDAAKP